MLVSTRMITGFNTDVRHEGHVYHVQTEDGGKDNPILESLIYVGGTIVAKKLTPYPELTEEDGRQAALAALLKRQHQVIIAAIKAGRIDDLIRHSLKQQSGTLPAEEPNSQPVAPVVATPRPTVDPIKSTEHRRSKRDGTLSQERPKEATPKAEPLNERVAPAPNSHPNSTRPSGRLS